MVTWVKHFDALPDFLSLVYLCAPNDFPREDFLKDEEQLTLDRAFQEIEQGMKFVQARISDRAVLDQLRTLLNTSFAAYKAGNRKQGSHSLQEFKKIVLKNSKNSPGRRKGVRVK